MELGGQVRASLSEQIHRRDLRETVHQHPEREDLYDHRTFRRVRGAEPEADQVSRKGDQESDGHREAQENEA